jgi:A/G-specific adenine glycosylase
MHRRIAEYWVDELVNWFEKEHRPMPWRDEPTPYRVWVSEIMLQQTQVVTVIPYYDRFVAKFPSIEALAASDSQDVLKVWEGLGYYSRARNLRDAARMVVDRFQGQLPSSISELRQLPGIGPYTAAAIASIAFGQPLPAIDGNGLRTFARFFGIDENIRKPKTAQIIGDRLAPLIRRTNPSHFNQAVMEVGALICRPRNPSCGKCLLAAQCVAFRTGRTEELPVTTPRPSVPHYRVAVGVIWKNQHILIALRHERQMLGGLWEFPGGKVRRGETPRSAVVREVEEETGLKVCVGKPYATVKHAYSHFRVTLTAFQCAWVSGRPQPHAAVELRWIKPRALGDYPFPKANRRIASAVLEAQGPL